MQSDAAAPAIGEDLTGISQRVPGEHEQPR
jgi:hypothetical protein